MSSTAWTFRIPAEKVQDFRELLDELKADLSGLDARARDVGYNRERMWLQANDDGSAQLIVYLELEKDVDLREFSARLLAYDSEFTRWWRPRFESFGVPTSFGRIALAWDREDNVGVFEVS